MRPEPDASCIINIYREHRDLSSSTRKLTCVWTRRPTTKQLRTCTTHGRIKEHSGRRDRQRTRRDGCDKFVFLRCSEEQPSTKQLETTHGSETRRQNRTSDRPSVEDRMVRGSTEPRRATTYGPVSTHRWRERMLTIIYDPAEAKTTLKQSTGLELGRKPTKK